MKIRRTVILATAAAALSCRQVARPGNAGSPPVMGESSTQAPVAPAVDGRTLFLKNCAHCHGADAHGDEGPDLHNLGLSDEWITNRIRNGKPGQMTAFAGKLQASEITALVGYVQTLK